MTQILDHVQPGDVITADQWNLVVDAVNGLLQAGQTNGIVLAATSPAGTADDPVLIGTLLQITGQSFGFALGQTSVTFEGGPSGNIVMSRSQLLAGSSDSRLLLIVPSIPGISQSGQTMTLRVSNGVANDSRSVLVKPVVIPLTGDIFVTWRAAATPNPNPNPLQTAQEVRFALQLQTGINLPATFILSADIQNATVAVPAGLVSSIEFRNDSDAVISNNQVDLGKNETRNITVRIPQLPSSFAGQTFTLNVAATASGVTGVFSKSFTVGVAVPPTDPNIQSQLTGSLMLDAAGNTDTNPADGSLTGTTISLKANLEMIVMFNLTLTQAGNYDLTIQANDGSTTNWSPQLTSTPGTIAGPVTNRLVKFSVTPSSTASMRGSVVFRIKQQGATADWSQEFGVQLLS